MVSAINVYNFKCVKVRIKVKLLRELATETTLNVGDNVTSSRTDLYGSYTTACDVAKKIEMD